ncbi:MerR family transcriptional regulator [Novosphingobium rosa]|uniref:MerR family transcriptional regulator n=1 Tax=Novosphingobium rosa TaxID=76978 RepID=UPI0008370270|nr:MerR family DNA-binding protein [Novosphingobium rosa]
MSDMTISTLARAGGVGVETVRFYQRKGLLEVPRQGPAHGHGGSIRRYGAADARRLRFIRQAQAAGFTLEEIGELIALDSTQDRARARTMAQGRIAALDAQIAQLTAARDALSRLAHDCEHGDAGPCPILAAFETRHCETALGEDHVR